MAALLAAGSAPPLGAAKARCLGGGASEANDGSQNAHLPFSQLRDAVSAMRWPCRMQPRVDCGCPGTWLHKQPRLRHTTRNPSSSCAAAPPKHSLGRRRPRLVSIWPTTTALLLRARCLAGAAGRVVEVPPRPAGALRVLNSQPEFIVCRLALILIDLMIIQNYRSTSLQVTTSQFSHSCPLGRWRDPGCRSWWRRDGCLAGRLWCCGWSC